LTDIAYLLIVNNSLNKRYVFRGQGQSRFTSSQFNAFLKIEAGGGMTAGIKGGNPIVVISGNSNPNATDTKGRSFTESPADILAHELVGHAIPRAIKADTGNAVENANKVHSQIPGKPLRAVEPRHFE
jgi:hypothetical protein